MCWSVNGNCLEITSVNHILSLRSLIDFVNPTFSAGMFLRGVNGLLRHVVQTRKDGPAPAAKVQRNSAMQESNVCLDEHRVVGFFI